MGISAALILLFCSLGSTLADKDAYALKGQDLTLVRRQAQYSPQADQQQQPQQQQPQYAAQPQQALDSQASPDYYNYIQQLQQLSAQAQQPSPQQQYLSQPPEYLQQSLQSTAPQSFQSQQPPRRAFIPEDQRILQESLARRPIVNQEREDQRRQELISLGIDPTALRRQMIRDNVARQLQQQAVQDAARKQYSFSNSAEEQLAAFFADAGPQQIVPHIQTVPVPQSIPVRQRQEEPQQAPVSPDQHQRVSYSQISFGSPSLPRPQSVPDSQQHLLYQQQPVQRAAQYSPQPHALPQQQVSFDPEYFLHVQRAAQQQADPRPEERGKIIYHAPQQVTYIQPTEQQGQSPQQYLIETTKTKEQPNQVFIPKRLSYRPEANYKSLHASIAAQQHQAQLAQQQLEAATTSAPPSRSSIFVTTAKTPIPKVYSGIPEYRIPKNDQQRPLTQSELNALINAGFSVTPSPNQPEYQEYFRGLAKRQHVRPSIGQVSLSDEDKRQLAESGIRNLYRVQGAESRDTPVRYVLAVENQKRDTDKA